VRPAGGAWHGGSAVFVYQDGAGGVTWLPLHAGLPLRPALSATSTPVFALW
jgi:hypothetical protein